jgi:hypothetical protein
MNCNTQECTEAHGSARDAMTKGGVQEGPQRSAEPRCKVIRELGHHPLHVQEQNVNG